MLSVCHIPLFRRDNVSDVVKQDQIIIEEYHGITEEDKAFMTLYSMTDKCAYLPGKKRKQERQQLAKQFLEAKKAVPGVD